MEMEGEPDVQSSWSWEDVLSSARVVLSERDKLLLKTSSLVREIVCVCVHVCVYGTMFICLSGLVLLRVSVLCPFFGLRGYQLSQMLK